MMKLIMNMSKESRIRLGVLLILCCQTSVFTLMVRYSRGILKETYSNYEVLLVGEVIKIIFSAWMINDGPKQDGNLIRHLLFVVSKSHKMVIIALIYGAMNILYFVSLRNIGAGLFSILSQCKILTTAFFSVLLLGRSYSNTRWAALVGLLVGVILFSEPILSSQRAKASSRQLDSNGAPATNPVLGMAAVLMQMSLSGYSCIYFEKVIKTDPLQLSIWERNFQLALASIPVYIGFIASQHYQRQATLSPEEQESYQFGRGWSIVTCVVTILEASGGLLVALSIKYGDAVLKTLATTGSIVATALVDHFILNGPLTGSMIVAGSQVILSIVMYTFDTPQQKETDSEMPAIARWLPKKTGKRITLLAILPLLAMPLRNVHGSDKEEGQKHVQRARNSVMPMKKFEGPNLDVSIDVVSIGSNTRLEYQTAQNETWASPEFVRHFFAITEEDDHDPTCQKRFRNVKTLKEHITMCREKHQKGGPFLRLHTHMSPEWVDRQKNPTGWFCAQGRPGAGLAKARRKYESMGGSMGKDTLPDFLVLVEDDSYIDLPKLRTQVFPNVDSSLRRVWATCMKVVGSSDRRDLYRVGHFGGGGVIFSKATLKRMMIPISCVDTENGGGWNKHVCKQLDRNLLGEKDVFNEGMTMFHFIEAFFSQDPNCFTSDWPIGFFVDYYSLADPWDEFPLQSKHAVRLRPLVANSVKHFRQSLDLYNMDDGDLFSMDEPLSNTTGSLCPYVAWEKVKEKCPPGVLACHLSAKEMKKLFVASVKKFGISFVA